MLELSSEMVELRSELQRVLTCSEAATGADDAAPLRTESLCQSDVERTVVDCVSARRFGKALQCVRYYGYDSVCTTGIYECCIVLAC